MTSTPLFVLPGDQIPPSHIPSHPKKPLRLGPGIHHSPPQDLIPTIAGRLITEHNKNAIRIETATGRYTPRVGELVIGTVHHSTSEAYFVTLSDHTSPALLPHLSFEGASKKTRPVLSPGCTVYARVSLANKHMDAEIECVNSSTGKADGMGPLMGGMVFCISSAMSRRLMINNNNNHNNNAAQQQQQQSASGGLIILDDLAAAGLQFETATGRNGKIWVNSDNVKTILAVGRAVQETDEGRLDVEDQKKLVRRLIKELS